MLRYPQEVISGYPLEKGNRYFHISVADEILKDKTFYRLLCEYEFQSLIKALKHVLRKNPSSIDEITEVYNEYGGDGLRTMAKNMLYTIVSRYKRVTGIKSTLTIGFDEGPLSIVFVRVLLRLIDVCDSINVMQFLYETGWVHATLGKINHSLYQDFLALYDWITHISQNTFFNENELLFEKNFKDVDFDTFKKSIEILFLPKIDFYFRREGDSVFNAMVKRLGKYLQSPSDKIFEQMKRNVFENNDTLSNEIELAFNKYLQPK